MAKKYKFQALRVVREEVEFSKRVTAQLLGVTERQVYYLLQKGRLASCAASDLIAYARRSSQE